jgi:hypothetical protein
VRVYVSNHSNSDFIDDLPRKLAAEDPLWRAMQGHEDVTYRIHAIESGVFNAWTRTPQPELHPEPSFINNSLVGFLQADRLLKIRNTIISRPRISRENLIELGSSVAFEDRQIRQQFLVSQKSANRKVGRKSAAHHDDNNATIMAENAAKKARDPSTIKEMKKELDVAIARLDSAEDEDLPIRPSNATGSSGAPASLSATSLLGKTRLGSSTSSKLNYIINEVCNTLT